MSQTSGSSFDLIERMRRKAPEYVDLLTACTDEDFERAFDALLEKGIMHLESNKKHFEKLDEEGLSSVLCAFLTIPGLTVSQEKHSNGHVDLTIEADHCTPARKKLGEAKIYNGPAYHLSGLMQLLGRYTTGREGRGLLIVYFRKQNIAGLIQTLRERMNAERPLRQQGDTTNHLLRWSFLSTHAHSCGENLEVGHIGCNLCNE